MGLNMFDQFGLPYIDCVGHTTKLVFGYGTLF